MNRYRRFQWCLALQVMIACCFMTLQSLFLPESDALHAFAEVSDGFSVEVTAETPLPTIPDAPTESPAPTETPQRTVAPQDTSLRVEVLRTDLEPMDTSEKRILIYHTHTWEAYQQDPNAPYRETEKWRTKDERCNVIAVGNALSASLTALGVTVVHDTTAFEPPNLDAAYSRSLAMLEDRTAAGEIYDLYIDLHRDAIASSSTIRRTVQIGGESVARFMVLVGKGTTGGYAEKPDWEANCAIADRITSSLNGQCDGLARDIKIKTGRFNQHIAPRCVLIECGVNTNTLEEVLRGIPYLAQAIADALAEPPAPET